MEKAVFSSPRVGQPDAGSPLLLLYARTDAEENVLRGWIEETGRVDTAAVHAGRDELAEWLAGHGDGDPNVVPVRVAWLPTERGGARRARLRDVLALRDPRQPTAAAQARITRKEPERYRAIAGEDELRRLNRSHALVFLPSHRSYLDTLVLRPVLHRHGFPPNHVLGGSNLDFWPLGPVARRNGYVFIRRSMKDAPVYKAVLREYLGYLLRKRFNLEWYIEGGRTRTGKLRPPRYGILRYLVDAFRESGIDDVYLVPVAVVYDQLHEVAAMAAEEHGASKQAEGLGWIVNYVRAQRRPFGAVHLAFGEPLSLAAALREEDSSIPKIAFEVLNRVNGVTPITPAALASLA